MSAGYGLRVPEKFLAAPIRLPYFKTCVVESTILYEKIHKIIYDT
jgi:hypothetical protein